MSDNVHSFYITLTPFSESDHFADVSKMIRNVHPRDSLWLKRLIELGATYSR